MRWATSTKDYSWAIGCLILGDIKPGHWRELLPEEVGQLKRLVATFNAEKLKRK